MPKGLPIVIGLLVLAVGVTSFLLSAHTLATGGRGDFFIPLKYQGALVYASFVGGLVAATEAVVALENKILERIAIWLLAFTLMGVHLGLLLFLPHNLQFHPEGGLTIEDHEVLLVTLGFSPAFGIAGGLAYLGTSLLHAGKRKPAEG